MLPETQEKIVAVKALVKKDGITYKSACEKVGIPAYTFYTYNISGVRNANLQQQRELVEKIYQIHKESGKRLAQILREMGISRHKFSRMRTTSRFKGKSLYLADRMTRKEFIQHRIEAKKAKLRYDVYFRKLGFSHASLKEIHSGVGVVYKWSKEEIKAILEDRDKNNLDSDAIYAKYNIYRNVLRRMAKCYNLKMKHRKMGRPKKNEV